jgi:hypothetical protein
MTKMTLLRQIMIARWTTLLRVDGWGRMQTIIPTTMVAHGTLDLRP